MINKLWGCAHCPRKRYNSPFGGEFWIEKGRGTRHNNKNKGCPVLSLVHFHATRSAAQLASVSVRSSLRGTSRALLLKCMGSMDVGTDYWHAGVLLALLTRPLIHKVLDGCVEDIVASISCLLARRMSSERRGEKITPPGRR